MILARQTIKPRKILVLFILFIEAIILYCGVTLPLVKVSHFWIFEEEQSIVRILLIFYQHEEFLLLILISIMGLILPFLKLILRGLELEGKIFKFIGRFSSIDIFLISILIFIGKSVSNNGKSRINGMSDNLGKQSGKELSNVDTGSKGMEKV